MSPFSIAISRRDQVNVLATEESSSPCDMAKVLTEAVRERIITEEQLNLLNELAGKFGKH